MSSVVKDFKCSRGVVQKRVGGLLKAYPDTRDNDKALITRYMTAWHDLKARIGSEAFDIVKEVIFEEMPTFETITRMRRKYQENGLFLASTEASASRLEAEAAVRDWSRG